MIQVRDGKIRRSEASLELEINVLQRLVDRRHEWLANPLNKMRNTYEAVLHDTRNMEYQLLELQRELHEIKNSKK